MPLQKNKTIRGGYSADYHKITLVHFDVLKAEGHCIFSTWKDKAAYDAGESSVSDYRLDIPSPDFVALAEPGNPAGLYETLSDTLYTYFRDTHTVSTDEGPEDGPLRSATLVE